MGILTFAFYHCQYCYRYSISLWVCLYAEELFNAKNMAGKGDFYVRKLTFQVPENCTRKISPTSNPFLY